MDDFELDEDEGRVIVPDELTVSEAVSYVLETAKDSGWSLCLSEIGGFRYKVGFIEIEDMQNQPHIFTEGYKRDLFIEQCASFKALYVPFYTRPALPETYAFKSETLEKFFATPHIDLKPKTIFDTLEQVQKEYVDHLFDVLQKSAKNGDEAGFKECQSEIVYIVVESTPNARAYLTEERREMLVELLAKFNSITPQLSLSFRTAGSGPDPWEKMEEACQLAAARMRELEEQRSPKLGNK